MQARTAALAGVGMIFATICPSMAFSDARGSGGEVAQAAAQTRAVPGASPELTVPKVAFPIWINDFRGRAQAAGISLATLDSSLAGIAYQPSVIARDRHQSEFTKTVWEYLDAAVSPSRIAAGRAAMGKYTSTLRAVGDRTGVDPAVVTAIWGLESSYGTHRGDTPIIPALASLAYDGRRAAFFEEQLIAALRIVQAGDVSAARMVGSWAGAMGHTQFMPTSYLSYAVDFTGDGKRDIWSDNPADALASTAAYLKAMGWETGAPWGVEVRLPERFDFSAAGHGKTRSVAAWTEAGIRGTDGQPVADHGPAAILLPAGARGPAFMIFRNFNVISRYNAADAYVLAVGHLSDRLKGGPAFAAAWPRGDRALAFAEKQELQQRLTAAGFSTQGIDGRIGPNTVAAIRAFQASTGLTPDGYPSPSLLDRLR